MSSSRVFLLLVLLVGICVAQRGEGRGSSRGSGRGGKKDRPVEESKTDGEMREGKRDEMKGEDKKAPKLPKQKFIFKGHPWTNAGPMLRSFTNESCQMVCRGSFSLPQFGNREYFKYHQINLTDCFRAPQITGKPMVYDSSEVTRLDASMGVFLSHPEPVFERAEFGPTGLYTQGDFYFEFGMFAPARAMDSRVYVDWEVRRNISAEFMGSEHYDSCMAKLETERNQEMEEGEGREEEQPRWKLNMFTKMEPVMPSGDREEREERMESWAERAGEDMKRRTMDRMEKMVNKQLGKPNRMRDEM